MDCYVIYHVFGKKVGCTKDYPQRCYNQGLVDGEFEPIECISLAKSDAYAGDIEWQWADYFGYKRKGHYTLSMEQRSKGGKVGGKVSFASQISRGTHVSQTGNTPWHTGALQRGFREKDAAKKSGQTLRRLGTSGFKTGAAGKVGGRNGQLKRLAEGTHITQRVFTCPNCGMTGKVPGILHHFKKCG